MNHKSSKKKKKVKNKLTIWLTFESFIIVNVSVIIYELVDFVANYIVGQNHHYSAIAGIGMFLPMSILMGFISYRFSKLIYRYVSKLIDGINQVANGNFDVQLNEKKAGPFREVYRNFNKMGRELESVQLLREDFINNFSHEFKTPIASINGFANLLLEKDISKEDEQKYLKIISEESARLADLAQSTLLLSKLESSEVIVDKTPYSLDEQLKQCAILLSTDWSRKKIDFSANLSSVTYNGNRELMQHVWINLLNNAIKFTPENGELSMDMTEIDGMIQVSITDTGMGMSEETASNIFEKYYQGENSKTIKGLGLGLSIVKRIVELCDGTISVKSKENEGSTFTVSLPSE
ncbi:sensor histidine kinase [Anaeromicropila herbilytica]|uniref:histidine kinase n=1 Tax=Anaeromicropila herbilytica TaxID=2785025 RepID=A0A7R7EHJ9_9FIRM|nr:HAMP domain-containing sensor histidine kinase [Anaeromicropila herbilytica]BCN28887.1 two component sensor kinase [Anaeromicropila herbilytica]